MSDQYVKLEEERRQKEKAEKKKKEKKKRKEKRSGRGKKHDSGPESEEDITPAHMVDIVTEEMPEVCRSCVHNEFERKHIDRQSTRNTLCLIWIDLAGIMPSSIKNIFDLTIILYIRQYL